MTQSAPQAAHAAVARTEQVLGALGDRIELCPGIRGAELDRIRSRRRASDRADALAAHLLVRRAAVHGSGDSDDAWRGIGLDYVCPDCGADDHGVPMLRMPQGQARASISHARGVVAAVVGGVSGIDVESFAVLEASDPGLWLAAGERRHAAEQRDYAARSWTMKEALVKVGVLRLDDMTTVDARPIIDAALAGRMWTASDGRKWSARSTIDGDAVTAVVSSVVIRGFEVAGPL